MGLRISTNLEDAADAMVVVAVAAFAATANSG